MKDSDRIQVVRETLEMVQRDIELYSLPGVLKRTLENFEREPPWRLCPLCREEDRCAADCPLAEVSR